jgi:two-component system, sensor histidine kinase RegB
MLSHRMHRASETAILSYLRLAALIGQALAVLLAWRLFDGRFAVGDMCLVLAGYALWQVLYLARTRRRPVLSSAQMTFELAVDLLVITVLLYLAGGWTNPFASCYLIPLAFGAVVLPARYSVALGALALSGYAFIVPFHQPLPSVYGRFGGDFSLHVLGMWMSFVIGTVVLITAVAWVRGAHERQRLALAREREARLRDEQLLALGALAASTAHELGTPLGTARLLVEELEESAAGEDREPVRTLAQQLDYAIDKMRALVQLASHGAGAEDATLSEFVDRIVDRFRILRPEIELETVYTTLPDLRLCDTRLLESAILGLLINAANASDAAGSQRVEFDCGIDDGDLTVGVRDYGPGMEDADAQVGLQPVTSKRGFGVGLVISSATFERYGGLARHLRGDPGTRVVVSLPLAGLTRALS